MVLNIILPKLAGEGAGDFEKFKKAASNQWSEAISVNLIEVEGESYPAIFNQALSRLEAGYALFLFPWVILKDKVIESLEFSDSKGLLYDLVILGYERISWNQPEYVTLENHSYDIEQFALLLHQHPGDITYTGIWNKIFSVEKIKELEIECDEDLKEGYQQDFLLKYLKGCQNVAIVDNTLATFYTQPDIPLLQYQRIDEKDRLLQDYQELFDAIGMSQKGRQIVDEERVGYIVYETLRLKESSNEEQVVVRLKLDDLKHQMECYGPKIDMLIKAKVIKGFCGNIKNYWQVERKNELRLKKEQKKKAREKYWQENYYKLRRPIRVLHKWFSSSKKVLLYCESQTMKSHIFDYYSCVKDMPGVSFYIYYPDNWDNEVPERCKLVRSPFAALNTPWDLLVCADAKVPLYYRKCEASIMYINHGLHMISYDGGESLYAYNEGAGLFTTMLEPNKSYAEIMSANAEENVIHVGYKNAESIISEIGNKSQYRKKLGLDNDKKIVSVFGTWGPDSIFHRVGNSLISQAKALSSEGYQFILSIHPKEYSRYDETVEPLGEYIDSLAEQGFIIRNPKEPSIDYMVAADIVICDYSTLCEEAMLAGKPVILSDFPAERVWKNSIIAKYMKDGIVFSNESDLRALLLQCEEDTALQDYAASLVQDLLPPEDGYKAAVYNATTESLGIM